jgi:2-aminophenol/2-amino-5-chlorophenol 1,6-dioxygenase subunit alpha
MTGPFVAGVIVPTLPHPLLAPTANAGYARLRAAYDAARARISALRPDVLVLYSTRWPSVIGHQIQADPNPEWVHVDEDFHALGSIPYALTIDADLAHAYQRAATARGLAARTVAYRGFPIDTGSVVALQLLAPDGAIPATITSCNMYADRAETLILGKAASDAVAASGKRAVAVAVTDLSRRLHTRAIDPAEDRIYSSTHDEWNRKLLEFLAAGRLEDVSQLARTFTAQAHGDSKLKAIWWLAAAMGQNNAYTGEVLAYEPVHGAGCTVTWLRPAARPAPGLEFDEQDVETYRGERNVLEGGGAQDPPPSGMVATPSWPGADDRAQPAPAPVRSSHVRTDAAPKPVGPYPHARREGDLLFVSGMGPRQPGTDEIPGGPIRDASGAPLPYDTAAQTHAVIQNIARVLEASGTSLDSVVDVTCFLVDMDRDFATFNEVYRHYFEKIGPTRTTVAVRALPTPIAVELKVIARVPRG